METPKVFESEYRFCLILWEREPIKSGELVSLCRERLGWKPTTTYTVIKRLSERGVLKNENSVVSALVTKDEVQAAEINEMVEKTFEGSLPAFIAAFTKHQKISEKELDAVQAMIDRYLLMLGKSGNKCRERAFKGFLNHFVDLGCLHFVFCDKSRNNGVLVFENSSFRQTLDYGVGSGRFPSELLSAQINKFSALYGFVLP